MTNTVVITGASSGMGLSATKLFLKNGWNVVMADYDETSGKKVESELVQKYSADRVFFTRQMFLVQNRLLI